MTYFTNDIAERADQKQIVHTECLVYDAHGFGCGMNTNLRTVRFAHDDATCGICGYAAINITLARYGLGQKDTDGLYTYGIHVIESRFEDYAIAWGTDISDWGVE